MGMGFLIFFNRPAWV